MHYNFCRIHGSLRVTPAMQAGVADPRLELGGSDCAPRLEEDATPPRRIAGGAASNRRDRFRHKPIVSQDSSGSLASLSATAVRSLVLSHHLCREFLIQTVPLPPRRPALTSRADLLR